MRRGILLQIFTIVSAGVWILCSCTNGPVAGTETGNPDITACLASALSLFDSTEAWVPSTYLVDGERQLSPQNVYSPPSTGKVAKRAATDSTPADKEGGSVGYDTVFIVDTLFNRDTVILETVTYDTINEQFGADSAINELVIQQILYDSVFITDTQVVRDTFLIVRSDSEPATNTPDSQGNTKIDLTDHTDDSASTYSVERDPETGEIVLIIPPANFETSGATATPSFEVRSDSSLQMIARKVTISGVSVEEIYMDADGDGMMTTAQNNVIPLLGCTGIYTGITMRLDLAVDFDAGVDHLFSTDRDNRIRSLWRRKVVVDGTIEQVRYGNRYFGQNGDTCILLRERDLPPADSTTRIVERYLCRSGADPLDHRENRLFSCRRTIDYRTGNIRNIDLTVTPSAELSAGAVPEQGSLKALIDFGKGLTGVIDAVIDYTDGTITGVYAQAGTEYRLSYQQGEPTVILVPCE
ncbi:MAG: hypothetical protein JW863_18210 [Chitinispirillaceae bacterium]|nr:hypothetical protein [Chitinispirillaceae bacterium]